MTGFRGVVEKGAISGGIPDEDEAFFLAGATWVQKRQENKQGAEDKWAGIGGGMSNWVLKGN